MKVIRWFTIAAALSMPSTLLAQGAQERPMEEQPPQQQGQEQQEKKSQAEMDKVKAHVVPAVTGIQVADKAVSALHELAGAEQLDKKDAQKTVQLAEDGIQMALTRTQALNKMEGLSAEAKSEADSAMKTLREARTNLKAIQKKVQTKQARIPRKDIEQIREQAKNLHQSLSDAESSVEQVAKAYDVPTDLEMGG
jgi:hypothetical protein